MVTWKVAGDLDDVANLVGELMRQYMAPHAGEFSKQKSQPVVERRAIDPDRIEDLREKVLMRDGWDEYELPVQPRFKTYRARRELILAVRGDIGNVVTRIEGCYEPVRTHEHIKTWIFDKTKLRELAGVPVNTLDLLSGPPGPGGLMGVTAPSYRAYTLTVLTPRPDDNYDSRAYGELRRGFRDLIGNYALQGARMAPGMVNQVPPILPG